MTEPTIDDIDRELIRNLQIDGRTPYSQLAGLVGLSDGATRQRVNRLVSTGVINIVAVTDPGKLGVGFQALLGITAEDDVRKIAAKVSSHEAVVYAVMTAGRFDLIAEIITRDTPAFMEVSNTIRTMPGIRTVEAMPYLGITKEVYDWGVG